MRCHYHPQLDAQHKCAGCQKPLCDSCIQGQRPDAPLCHTCQALQAASDHRRLIAQSRVQVAQIEARRERNHRLRVILAWCVILLCTGIVLMRIPVLVNLLQSEQPIRNGTQATDALTDACIRNLWHQSALMRQGKSPDASLICPVSRKPYRIVEKGGNLTVACPHPDRHGLTELAVSRNRPTPRVRK
jgi:uncharacterized membrane protein YqjE